MFATDYPMSIVLGPAREGLIVMLVLLDRTDGLSETVPGLEKDPTRQTALASLMLLIHLRTEHSALTVIAILPWSVS
jgi:hypothetical protein